MTYPTDDTRVTQQLEPSTLLPTELRPYQQRGVSFLIQSKVALLADEMGLGKTVEVAVALRILFATGQCRRALVVTPRSLRRNWRLELARWAPNVSVRAVTGTIDNRLAAYLLPVPVLIATYDQIRRDAALMARSEVFDLVILDEAQRIKNRSSKTSIACQIIPRHGSWALTGTPMENHPSELVALFSFLKPGLLHDHLRMAELHDRMKPYFLRRTKAEVLPELPPIISQNYHIEMGAQQRQAYMHAWSAGVQSVREAGEAGVAHLFALLTRLKQLCNHDLASGESAKWDILELIFTNARDASEKVLVFSQYVRSLEWIAAQPEIIPLGLFHGGLSEDDRVDVLHQFRSEPAPRALLLSLKAGYAGLNLQEASTVVLFDRWWNPAVETQAVQRAHRFGRVEPLHAFRFITEDTVEERIDAILERKQELFDRYVGAAESTSMPLSRNELLSLLGI